MFFLWFCEVLRDPREVVFAAILDNINVFGENVGPSFFHTFIAFWLDFQGPGPPGESKKREKKQLQKINLFLSWKKGYQKRFFLI